MLVKDQSIAVRCYIKGIHPKYIKFLKYNDSMYTSLAEAKAAVTLAVAQHDQVEIGYANFNAQKARGVAVHRQTSSNINTSSSLSHQPRSQTQSYSGTRVSLSTLSATHGSDLGDQKGQEGSGVNESEEGQVAAVAAVGSRLNIRRLNPKR